MVNVSMLNALPVISVIRNVVKRLNINVLFVVVFIVMIVRLRGRSVGIAVKSLAANALLATTLSVNCAYAFAET